MCTLLDTAARCTVLQYCSMMILLFGKLQTQFLMDDIRIIVCYSV